VEGLKKTILGFFRFGRRKRGFRPPPPNQWLWPLICVRAVPGPRETLNSSEFPYVRLLSPTRSFMGKAQGLVLFAIWERQLAAEVR